MTVKTPLLPDETVLRETRCNTGREPASVRGTLTLTDHRLVFEPVDPQTQSDVQVLPVGTIASAARVYLPGPLGFHNVRSLQVRQRDGTERTFMVRRPIKWVEALEQVGVTSG